MVVVLKFLEHSKFLGFAPWTVSWALRFCHRRIDATLDEYICMLTNYVNDYM